MVFKGTIQSPVCNTLAHGATGRHARTRPPGAPAGLPPGDLVGNLTPGGIMLTYWFATLPPKTYALLIACALFGGFLLGAWARGRA